MCPHLLSILLKCAHQWRDRSAFWNRKLYYCREEIAECSERAYASLSTADAKELMLFGSDQEALSYAQEVSPATFWLPWCAAGWWIPCS